MEFAKRALNSVAWRLFLGLAVFFCACNSQKKIIFRPEPVQTLPDPFETARIIETQNGPPTGYLPEWVSLFLGFHSETLYAESIRIRQIETLSAYRDMYVFIGKNRGSSFNALRQWADRFTVVQDFPRLAAERIESRLLSTAVLYPDDEYGDFFEILVKNAYNADYPEAVKTDSFWIKRRVSSDGGEGAAETDEADVEETIVERELYEFFVLISIDKIVLQGKIQELLANTHTAVRPTRDQAATINRVKQNFFEGF